MRNALFLATAFAAALAMPSLAAEPESEAIEIPLEEIWALDMPGTQDIRELDAPDDPIVDKVLKQISETRKFDHCFVVRGEGSDALREFLRVRTDHAYWNRLPANEPLSLVFYTKPIREAVELVSVTQEAKVITLRYRYAPRDSNDRSSELAVIPVGALDAGDFYTVKIERSTSDENQGGAEFDETLHERQADICMSCFFHVQDEVADSPAKIEVPLSRIWATDMLGTRDVRELGSPRAEDSLVERVLKQVRHTWNKDQGYVVSGEDAEALREFLRLRESGEPRNSLTEGEPVTLVFFTKVMGPYVELLGVYKLDTEITIQYRLVPHLTKDSRQHLALIPLGELTSGNYSVKLERLPVEQKYLAQGMQEPSMQQSDNVCGAFEFSVMEER
jgi:hypothetical protein